MSALTAGNALGLEGVLAPSVQATQRLVLLGKMKGKSWLYELRLPDSLPQGMGMFLIGQGGSQRGKLYPLQGQ